MDHKEDDPTANHGFTMGNIEVIRYDWFAWRVMNVFLERTLQKEERKDKKRWPLSDIAQYFHWGLFCELSVLDQYSIFQILACKLGLRRSRFSLLDPLLEALTEDLHHLYLSAFSILINDIFPVPSFTKQKKDHFVSSNS